MTANRRIDAMEVTMRRPSGRIVGGYFEVTPQSREKQSRDGRVKLFFNGNSPIKPDEPLQDSLWIALDLDSSEAMILIESLIETLNDTDKDSLIHQLTNYFENYDKELMIRSLIDNMENDKADLLIKSLIENKSEVILRQFSSATHSQVRSMEEVVNRLKELVTFTDNLINGR